MRHLTQLQALAALGRGAPIEQMLSENLASGSFSWLAALPRQGGFVMRLHHTVDRGSDSYLDVYEFGSVDEGDEGDEGDDLGDGESLGEYPDGATLMMAATEVGARPDRWVNAGLIQDEYRDLRSRL